MIQEKIAGLLREANALDNEEEDATDQIESEEDEEASEDSDE